MISTTESARVVEVAAGLESTGKRTPVRDARHLALDVLIGRWINVGHTIAAAGTRRSWTNANPNEQKGSR